MASSSDLLKPMGPHQAVTTLLLIENSHAMSIIWPDLRDRYLRAIVDKLGDANPVVSSSIIVLESLPVEAQQAASSVLQQHNRLHDSLRDLRFNFDPGNRLSAGKIWSAIDVLASTKFQGQPAACHLIIVAATTPSDETNGIDLGPFHERSPWHQLAQKLAQADIHCHLVTSPNQNMTPLIILFEEALRLQCYVEEPPSFSADPAIISLRLSARPGQGYYPDIVAPFANPSARRGTPHRNHTFPLDSHTMNSEDGSFSTSLDSPPENPPSLVSQLQQVHGLTKKKVYGTKPTRQPFIREERVREKYRRVPAPLNMPLPAPALPQLPMASNPGGRTISRSRVDRFMRVGQGSPTELPSRLQHKWPRRGSRVSSPEADGLSSSGSVSTFNDVSPITSYFSSSPTSHTSVERNFNMHVAIQHPSSSPSPALSMDGGTLEPTWLMQQYTSARQPPVFQSPFPQLPASPYSDSRLQDSSYDTDAVHQQMPSYFPTALAMPAEMNIHSDTKSDHETPPRSHRTSHSSAQDEERFTFNKEYVEATAALFSREVLPSYPNYPEINDSIHEIKPLGPAAAHDGYFIEHDGSLPPSPSYQMGELYEKRSRDDILHQPLQEDPTLAYSTSFSPGSSSSLTGWAG